jgi:hypothetical protein
LQLGSISQISVANKWFHAIKAHMLYPKMACFFYQWPTSSKKQPICGIGQLWPVSNTIQIDNKTCTFNKTGTAINTLNHPTQ